MVFLGVFRVIFLLVFGIYFHFSLFHASSSSPTPPVAVAGGMAMAFVDDCFLPLKARSSFHFLFFCFYVLCWLRRLAVQRCVGGFGEPASSAHVLVRGIGVSMNIP